MRYSDEDYLKESLELAKTAGIDEESIEKATRQLARLRMVDEVNKILDAWRNGWLGLFGFGDWVWVGVFLVEFGFRVGLCWVDLLVGT